MVIKSKNISALVYLSILYAPLIWVLGVGVMYFHLIAFVCFLFELGFYFKSGRKKNLFASNGITKIMIAYIVVYFFSIGFAIYDQAPTSRIVSSVFNLSYWVMYLFIISFISNCWNLESTTDRFVRHIWMVPFFVGSASLLCFLLYRNTFSNIVLNTPVTWLIGSFNLPNLIEYSSRVSLIIKDWVFNSQSIRTSVMGIYPTASAAIILLTVPIVFFQALEKKKLLLYSISTVLGVTAIFMTASRISAVAFFAGITGAYIINKRHTLLILFFFSLLILILLPALMEFIHYALQYRSGSSIHRIDMYSYGIEITNRTNIFFGLGYKPRLENRFFIPIGSHSTFIGAYVKTGLLGFLSVVTWQIVLLKTWIVNVKKIKKENKSVFMGIGASIIAMAIWMLTEDIDAPQLVMYTYAVLTGLMIVIVKDQVDTPKPEANAERVFEKPRVRA